MTVSATTGVTDNGAASLAGGDGAESFLMDSSVVGVLSVSQHGEVLAANGRMAVMLGLGSAEELVGRTMSGDLLVDANDWRHWRTAYAQGKCSAVAITLRGFSGRDLSTHGDLSVVRDRTGKVRLVGTFVDTTRERQLESAVLRGARMEALGGLTSGIAHDVNNLLTVLVGNLYLVGEELRGNPRLFDKVKPARDAAKRGATLTRQLLSFARRDPAQTELVNLGKVVEGLAPLLQQVMGKRIVLEVELEPGVVQVRSSAAHLESVIVNLAINARDAIGGKGKVILRVASRVLQPAEAGPLGLKVGEYAVLSVVDDGAGISDEVRERVFEPFFTTKKAQGGSGLGLSMVRWFTEQCGGVVSIGPGITAGTAVTLLIPRSSDGLGDTSAKTMPLSTLPTGDESVIVFAHDEALHATINETLKVLGYNVRLSREASEMFDTLHREHVDLMIVDASAGEGLALGTLLRRARALKPRVKMIVATTDGAEPAGLEDGPCPVLLPKPFSLADFAGTVRRTLDGVGHE